ncbi:radical SAM protein [candidate division WOR-1 bacterium DG_54_3]|uniref:Radical SAM protein n=1 Tax=candidate division WOR-1 bacterium DG_54_3 TaxID=1703775 RepID=A0A0S7Y1J7_UNCSA|nr:MAG: radical SAM protein [candidate division WOR-1 bacterium DG_54_3]
MSEVVAKKALFWEKREDGKIKCGLCPVGCVIAEGKVGVCMARQNKDGVLYAINYGNAVSIAIDPIEKKPLYHFHPGTTILSTGPNGCNLKCGHCQNWTISQVKSPTEYVSPENMVELALRYKLVGIAYTYTEPLIWYEYIADTAKIAKEKGLKNVLVTNGYICEKPLIDLFPVIDAMNVDVKSMEEDFYRKICKGKVEPVLRTVELAVKDGRHVEITNLVMPTLNDSEEQIQELVDWVAGLGDRIPVHFSRYFPHYKTNLPPTPVSTLKKAYDLAKKKLKHVYVGNAYIEGTSDTYCPSCSNVLVSREGYHTTIAGIKDHRCSSCGAEVDFTL